MITQGRTSSGDGAFTTAADYPLPSTRSTRLWLRDGLLAGAEPRSGQVASYVEMGTSVEEAPLVNGLTYMSRPLARATRLVGSAVFRAKVRVSSETMHLTPVLVDVAPDGTERTIERWFLHLDYRDGLGSADPVIGRWVDASVRLLPQGYAVAAGHRIGLRVQSSNTIWSVPGNPGTVDVAEGSVGRLASGSSLVIPTVGSQARFR